MIKFDFEKNCYSCGLCVSICPTKAISFDANLFPRVDLSRCVDCGLCDKNCLHINCKDFTTVFPLEVKGFVAKSLNDTVRRNSSSGGMFWHIANHVIGTGGIVCGVKFDDEFMPMHSLAYDMSSVSDFMGSKYVKSDMTYIYTVIESALKNGKYVCFSGVPCQIEAVNRAFKKYREQLILVAIVCHGVIDRNIWKKYLLEEQNNKKIEFVTMRDKSNGWLNYGLKFVFEDGTEHISFRKQDGYFLKCYTDGLMERDRCLTCKYKGDNISADILIGDGWGMDKLYPDMDDSLGISSVICLTTQGEKLFKSISYEMMVRNTPINSIIAFNQRIISSDTENKRRKGFLNYAEKPDINLHDLCSKYAKPTIVNRIKSKLQNK